MVEDGKILSQVEVEQMITHDVGLLEKITREYRDALKAEAEAEAEYKRRWAAAFLAASGARYIKEQVANNDCHEWYEAKLQAEARSKALKEYLWTIRGRLESLRSLNANIRGQV